MTFTSCTLFTLSYILQYSNTSPPYHVLTTSLQFERTNEAYGLASPPTDPRDDPIRCVGRALFDPVVSIDDQGTYPRVNQHGMERYRPDFYLALTIN